MLASGPPAQPTLWGSAALNELQQQLRKAGYTAAGPITSDVADLVGQLFGDVLKGAKYGKTARQLIEVRNRRIEELEGQLRARSSAEPAGTTLERLDDEQKHRVYRLLYVATSAVELLQKTEPKRGNVLTNLLEKDKSGSLGPRGEIADYWKVVAERDQLRSETAEKDAVIADLLADGGPAHASSLAQKLFISSRTILDVEEKLVKSIQALKSGWDARDDTKRDERNAHSTADIMGDKVATLEKERKTLEAELKHVQKTFAQHLKQCELQREEIEHPRGSAELTQQRARLQAALDRKHNECSALQRRLQDLEVDMAQKERQIEGMKQQGTEFQEELAALVTRCDLFETEFRQLESRRLEDDRKIKMLETDLIEFQALKKAHGELEAALENAQLSFISTDRALSDARDEITVLRIDLAKLNELKELTEGEVAKLRKHNVTANGALERLNQNYRELKNKFREREVEHSRLQQLIEMRDKDLDDNAQATEELRAAIKKAQDNEDAALLDKEEALRSQEQYRSALKDLKKRLDGQTAELQELKGRNRFLVTQLAEKLDSVPAEPETVIRIQRENEEAERPQLLSELNGLKLENKLLREKLASVSVMLQKTVAARKEAQAAAAAESVNAARFQAALEDLSDKQMTSSYPPLAGSWSRGRSSSRRQITASFAVPKNDTPDSSSYDSHTGPSNHTGNSEPISSVTYPTSSEGFTTYTNATAFSVYAPTSNPSTVSASATNSSRPTPGASTQTASLRTQFGSVTASSLGSLPLPSRTPPQTSSDTDRSSGTCAPRTMGPTPIPVVRSPRQSQQSFTERAMARIQQIMHDCDDDSVQSSSHDDTTPRHTSRRVDDQDQSRGNGAFLDSNELLPRQKSRTNGATMATSTGASTDYEGNDAHDYAVKTVRPNRRSQIFLSDEDYGHGGGYYWSPPPLREDNDTLSAGSLTYTNQTTNRSLTTGGERTDRSKGLIDGWITERTSNFL